MFFPAQPDALSPLLETVRVTEPPKKKERTVDFGSMFGPPVTAMPGPGLNVRNMAGEVVIFEED
jgi:hypothetical protein